MADQRALDAIARIERAIARIERGAAASRSPDPAQERLRAAHESLREKVAGAIGRLDQLIGQAERG